VGDGVKPQSISDLDGRFQPKCFLFRQLLIMSNNFNAATLQHQIKQKFSYLRSIQESFDAAGSQVISCIRKHDLQ